MEINPEQLWEYFEPNPDGTEKHVIKSEQEILDEYYPHWKEEMMRLGRGNLISPENCVVDWIVVNWASPVE